MGLCSHFGNRELSVTISSAWSRGTRGAENIRSGRVTSRATSTRGHLGEKGKGGGDLSEMLLVSCLVIASESDPIGQWGCKCNGPLHVFCRWPCRGRVVPTLCHELWTGFMPRRVMPPPVQFPLTFQWGHAWSEDEPIGYVESNMQGIWIWLWFIVSVCCHIRNLTFLDELVD